MKDKKVALYIRVSSEEQKREGLSLDAQLRKLEKYCDFKGWEIYKIYRDEGKSGGSINKRPEMVKLLEDSEKGLFFCVISTKIDRLFRNLSDAIKTLDKFRQLKVNFAFVEQEIDTTTMFGRILFILIALFAELERQMTIDRNRSIMLDKFERGIFIGKAPFGYKINKITKKISLDTKKAEIVSDCFKMASEGHSYKDICEKHKLKPQSYYNIIKNKIYMGIISFEGEEREGSHPKIISRELFEKLNH